MRGARKPDVEAPTLPSERALVAAAMALLVVALLLGGASAEGHLANGFLRLLSLPVLLLALWRISRMPVSTPVLHALLLLGAVLAVPFLQLVPLPPAVWEHLPGRAQFAETYRLAGMAPPWRPLSLNPEGTWNAALSLLPPAAMLVATLALDGPARRRITPVVLAVVTASVVLGVMQVSGGRGSPLRFYDITNPSAAVGFFANRNHQAALLLAALPLTAQWVASRARRPGAHRPLVFGFGLCLAAVFLVGLVVSGSRAGLVLAAPAMAAYLVLALRVDVARVSRRTWKAVAAAGLMLALLTLAVAVAARDRIAGLLEGEIRIGAASAILRAAGDYLPTGSGLGTFDPIYRMYEQPDVMVRAFLNHAHNDYLEIWLETGLVGLALLLVFLAWFFVVARRVWTGTTPGAELGRAASLAIGLLLIHSLVDYPLRTGAMATLFAFACGCLVPPAGPVERYLETKPPRRTRQRSGRPR